MNGGQLPDDLRIQPAAPNVQEEGALNDLVYGGEDADIAAQIAEINRRTTMVEQMRASGVDQDAAIAAQL